MNNRANPTLNDNNGAVEIDLGELFRAIWSNIGRILILALLGAIAALAITTFLIKPTYRSYFTAFINNKTSTQGSETSNSIQSGDVSAAMNLTYTYAAILSSRPIVEGALEESGLSEKYTYDEVTKHISTDIETNTQLVNLYVELHSAEDAYTLAESITQIAPGYMEDIVEGSSMKIVTHPVLATVQYSPSPTKNTVIGFVLGAFVMIVIVGISFVKDTRVKSEQDFEDRFGVPVIGLIPNVEAADQQKDTGYYYGKSAK